MDPKASSGRWPHLVFGLVLFACAYALLPTLSGAPRDPKSDDGFYLRFMAAVSDRGPGALRELFESWNADSRCWIYPSPLRVGFIAVSAVWARGFGATLDGLARLSAASHLLLVVVTYAFARRHLGAWRALLASALIAFSPLLLGMARLALADSFAVLAMSVALWTFLDFVDDPSRLGRLFVFAAAFSFAILVKEMAVILAIPFATYAALDARAQRRPAILLRHGSALALAACLAGIVLVLAAGSPARVVETARIVLTSPTSNRYAMLYGSGPWFRYVIDFLCLSPGPTLLAVGAVGALVLRPTGWEPDTRLGYQAIFSVGVLFALSFLTKNVRYAAVLETPIRVMAVCLLADFFRSRDPRRGIALTGAAVALLCWMDWRTFDTIWVRSGLYDPVSVALLGARSIVRLP